MKVDNLEDVIAFYEKYEISHYTPFVKPFNISQLFDVDTETPMTIMFTPIPEEK